MEFVILGTGVCFYFHQWRCSYFTDTPFAPGRWLIDVLNISVMLFGLRIGEPNFWAPCAMALEIRVVELCGVGSRFITYAANAAAVVFVAAYVFRNVFSELEPSFSHLALADK